MYRPILEGIWKKNSHDKSQNDKWCTHTNSIMRLKKKKEEVTCYYEINDHKGWNSEDKYDWSFRFFSNNSNRGKKCTNKHLSPKLWNIGLILSAKSPLLFMSHKLSLPSYEHNIQFLITIFQAETLLQEPFPGAGMSTAPFSAMQCDIRLLQSAPESRPHCPQAFIM